MTNLQRPDLPEGDGEQHTEDLEDGSLDPDELDDEPASWDEGADDET